MIRLYGIVNDSIVDGRGVRLAVFTQGCKHGCKGCHNPKSWKLDDGYEESVENILSKVKSNPLLDGITMSGGEPFLQPEPFLKIITEVKKIGLDVWCYSGYTYEEILCGNLKYSREILEKIDVLVDGKFEEDKKDLSLWYRGSSNQRVIDVQKSLLEKRIHILEFDE